MILKRFMLFLLLFAAAFLIISLPLFFQYQNNLQERLLAQEEASVVSATQMIQKEMYEQLHLLDLVVQSYALKEYLNEGNLKQKIHLEKFFKNISTTYHRFDQIRLLDNSGLEIIRVNLVDNKGQLVPEKDLQNKASRYYFKASQKMPLGQVYVSTLDLNIEYNSIEIPYKPTLRFTTPLKDADGNRMGALVINYLAKGMLERFRQLMTPRIDQQGMLLDSQGYWLSNHERSNEWGADLGKPEHKFERLYPKAWPVISANKSGIFYSDNGIFRYHSIEPLNFLDNKPAHFSAAHHALISKESYENTNWKLVIFIPYELINTQSFLYQPLGKLLIIIFMLLIVCVAFLSAIFSVQRQIRQQEQQQNLALLEQQANKDMLTGINNRRYFYEQGELEIKRALRQKTPLALLMLDADHFKKVNDTYGHAAGDLVLKDLAKTVNTVLREIDLFGRIGGEEFAILLPSTCADQAFEVAERLRIRLAEHQVLLPENESIRFTVSIGLVMLKPNEKDLDKLFKKTDLALYQAKAQGRNRVVIYDETLEGSFNESPKQFTGAENIKNR